MPIDAMPEHACAILIDDCDRLLLQLRPPWARHAAQQLCCFGGKREAGEDAVGCLARELAEELGWRPSAAKAAVDLRRGARFIARFFHVVLPTGTTLVVEPGSVLVRASASALPGLPLSPWHQAVLSAWCHGRELVDLDWNGTAPPTPPRGRPPSP
jgi:8-oxo-dGTP pyrophosphatase MutT (NUDIX family)